MGTKRAMIVSISPEFDTFTRHEFGEASDLELIFDDRVDKLLDNGFKLMAAEYYLVKINSESLWDHYLDSSGLSLEKFNKFISDN